MLKLQTYFCPTLYVTSAVVKYFNQFVKVLLFPVLFLI